MDRAAARQAAIAARQAVVAARQAAVAARKAAAAARQAAVVHHPLWTAFKDRLTTKDGQEVNKILQILWDLGCARGASKVKVPDRVLEDFPVEYFYAVLRYFFRPRQDNGCYWIPLHIMSFYMLGVHYYYKRRVFKLFDDAEKAAGDTIFFPGDELCLNPHARPRRRAPTFPKTKMQKPQDFDDRLSITQVDDTDEVRARDTDWAGPPEEMLGFLQRSARLFMDHGNLRNLLVEQNIASLSPARNVWEDAAPFIDIFTEDEIPGISGDIPPGIHGRAHPPTRGRPHEKGHPRLPTPDGLGGDETSQMVYTAQPADQNAAQAAPQATVQDDAVIEIIQHALQHPDQIVEPEPTLHEQLQPSEGEIERTQKALAEILKNKAYVGPGKDFMNQMPLHVESRIGEVKTKEPVEISILVNEAEENDEVPDQTVLDYEADDPLIAVQQEPAAGGEVGVAGAAAQPGGGDVGAAEEQAAVEDEPAVARPKRKYTYRWRGDNPRPKKKRGNQNQGAAQDDVPAPDPANAPAPDPVDVPAPDPVNVHDAAPADAPVPANETVALDDQQPPNLNVDMVDEDNSSMDVTFDVNNPDMCLLESKEVIRNYLKQRFALGEKEILFTTIALPGKWTRMQAARLMMTIIDLADMRYVTLESPRPHIALTQDGPSPNGLVIVERA